ncbi:MAG: peptidoglycan DD-metalloendopeptidase family protein [Bacillota bacterium]
MPRRPLVLLVISLVTAIGIAADLGWRQHIRPRFAVEVDGQVLGALREPEVAEEVLQTLQSQITPEMQVHVNLATKINVRPLGTGERMGLATEQAIQTALIKTIPDLREAVAITVNGRDIVAVADENSAKQVRDQILETYKATVLQDASQVEQLSFQESITWRKKVVKPENVRTVEEAINILRLGTDKLVTYVVKSGDTGWDIARNYSLTTEQLAKANPGVDLDFLQIGQSLNISYKEPHVHTRSVAKRLVKEGIPFREEVQKDPNLWPWQYQVITPGQWGTRELTIREYREDGKVVKTEVLENKVTAQPKTQVAKVGTKQVPAMGSGQLVFPVVGILTSAYGPRWGSYHYGVDIGAPTGTPILAADSGMVVFRGWSGNYGYMIKIDHGGGQMVTLYAHLSAFNVNLGDTVSKGDVIGYVGSTGYSTGPHLHFEVLVDGKSVNPLSYYP